MRTIRTTYRTKIIPFIPALAMPAVRTVYYATLGARAQIGARVQPRRGAAAPPVFIIGCGRSGTTLLGEIFGMHPKVKYLYEPYDRWAAVHRGTDFLRLYTRGEQHCLLREDAATSAARDRFERLMSPGPGLTLVEKSPINALRIGFLEALAPGARYVHIARDGVHVAHSINEMASVTRSMAFRRPLNDWWGAGDAKWLALVRDGKSAGYYPGEVGQLTSDMQRGAYEWMLSMREISAWRPRLGPRLIELRLDDLIGDPRRMLRAVTESVDLLPGARWLDRAAGMIRPVPNSYGMQIALPDQMIPEFNRFQEGYKFRGRAIPLSREG